MLVTTLHHHIASRFVWPSSMLHHVTHGGMLKNASNACTRALCAWLQGYNGKLTVGVLPSSLFCSGHTFFVQRKYEEYGLTPYVAHATFQYSGTPGKRHRFR